MKQFPILISALLFVTASAFADGDKYNPNFTPMIGSAEVAGALGGSLATISYADKLQEKAWEQALPRQAQALHAAEARYNSAVEAVERKSPEYFGLRERYELNLQRHPDRAPAIKEKLLKIESSLPTGLKQELVSSSKTYLDARKSFEAGKAALMAGKGAAADVVVAKIERNGIKTGKYTLVLAAAVFAVDGIRKMSTDPSIGQDPRVALTQKYVTETAGTEFSTMREAFKRSPSASTADSGSGN